MTKNLENDVEQSSPQIELDITPPDGDMSEVQSLLSELPQEMLIEALSQREGHSSKVRVERAISQSYSGPLPPPRMLHDYAQYAERVVTMAEKEQGHRHHLESTAVNGAINKDKRSQNYALFCIFFLSILSGGLILLDHEIAGSLFGGVTMVGIAALFITGKRDNKKKTEKTDEQKNEDEDEEKSAEQ